MSTPTPIPVNPRDPSTAVFSKKDNVLSVVQPYLDINSLIEAAMVCKNWNGVLVRVLHRDLERIQDILIAHDQMAAKENDSDGKERASKEMFSQQPRRFTFAAGSEIKFCLFVVASKICNHMMPKEVYSGWFRSIEDSEFQKRQQIANKVVPVLKAAYEEADKKKAGLEVEKASTSTAVAVSSAATGYLIRSSQQTIDLLGLKITLEPSLFVNKDTAKYLNDQRSREIHELCDKGQFDLAIFLVDSVSDLEFRTNLYFIIAKKLLVRNLPKLPEKESAKEKSEMAKGEDSKKVVVATNALLAAEDAQKVHALLERIPEKYQKSNEVQFSEIACRLAEINQIDLAIQYLLKRDEQGQNLGFLLVVERLIKQENLSGAAKIIAAAPNPMQKNSLLAKLLEPLLEAEKYEEAFKCIPAEAFDPATKKLRTNPNAKFMVADEWRGLEMAFTKFRRALEKKADVVECAKKITIPELQNILFPELCEFLAMRSRKTEAAQVARLIPDPELKKSKLMFLGAPLDEREELFEVLMFQGKYDEAFAQIPPECIDPKTGAVLKMAQLPEAYTWVDRLSFTCVCKLVKRDDVVTLMSAVKKPQMQELLFPQLITDLNYIQQKPNVAADIARLFTNEAQRTRYLGIVKSSVVAVTASEPPPQTAPKAVSVVPAPTRTPPQPASPPPPPPENESNSLVQELWNTSFAFRFFSVLTAGLLPLITYLWSLCFRRQ